MRVCGKREEYLDGGGVHDNFRKKQNRVLETRENAQKESAARA